MVFSEALLTFVRIRSLPLSLSSLHPAIHLLTTWRFSLCKIHQSFFCPLIKNSLAFFFLFHTGSNEELILLNHGVFCFYQPDEEAVTTPFEHWHMFNLVPCRAMLCLANCVRGNFPLTLSDSITHHCLILLVAAVNFRSHASHFIIHSSPRWNHSPPRCLFCRADTKMRPTVRWKCLLQRFSQISHRNCGIGPRLCLVGGVRGFFFFCTMCDADFHGNFSSDSLMILMKGTTTQAL